MKLNFKYKGPHNTQTIIKSDQENIGPSKYLNDYFMLIACQDIQLCILGFQLVVHYDFGLHE